MTTDFVPMQEGQVVKIIEPAYSLDLPVKERLEDLLCPLKVAVETAKDGQAGFGKLSGTDTQRASELVQAFDDHDVGAILIGHGGYGCMRLLDILDWEQIAKNPKPIIGYSDATALLNPIVSFVGSNAIHGPTAKSLVRDEDQNTLKAIRALLIGDWTRYNEVLAQSKKGNEVQSGTAQGKLYGGNLSLVVALCGTRFAVPTKGTILLLEDWNEPHYRIDRMLTQLKLSGFFDDLAGLVLGDFVSIQREGEDLPEKIVNRLRSLVPKNIPIVSEYPSGHGSTNLPLLMGADHILEAGELRLIS